MDKKRSSFTGRLGFVLAAAGSAVGLGNIWRFPYLAAKYGGGIFLLVYLILVATFGYTMIVSETAIGRMSGKSPVGAFKFFSSKKWAKFGGWLNAVIPMLIVPYYSVIGGWVCKYLFEYIKGNVQGVATDTFFSSFISNGASIEAWFLVFMGITIFVILMGVRNGIEKVSTIMMPVLIVLAVIICIYSLTRQGAIEGVKYFLIPNFSQFSWMTVVSALGQMFYSLSIAMGILITFGSYMNNDMDIEKSTEQVEVFDTLIAILAGLMIIPAVFAFSQGDASSLQAGPSLMFITLPKVFASFGFGQGAGILFFLLVLLAALTSSIALAESAVSTFEDEFGLSRTKATLFIAIIMISFGTLASLGFGPLSFIQIFGMDFLDFFDFLTNSVMMPIAAICTIVLVMKEITIPRFVKEIKRNSLFKREKIYIFVLKYCAIPFIAIILISSILNVLGIITM